MVQTPEVNLLTLYKIVHETCYKKQNQSNLLCLQIYHWEISWYLGHFWPAYSFNMRKEGSKHCILRQGYVIFILSGCSLEMGREIKVYNFFEGDLIISIIFEPVTCIIYHVYCAIQMVKWIPLKHEISRCQVCFH